jgi:small subunit ribosomal protein S10
MLEKKLTKIRVQIKAFNKNILNACCDKIQIVGTETNSNLNGPIFLPTHKRIYCVLRSPHVDKDSREHFEIRTHKRIFEITTNSPDSFLEIKMPKGASFDIKFV